MALDSESFKAEFYDLLKVRGYKPIPLNTKNQRVSAPQEADVFEFTFIKDGKEYGKSWVSIDDSHCVNVYFDNEQADTSSQPTPGMDYDDSWTGFLQHVKKWAQRRQLDFELSNKDRLGDDMKQRDYYKLKANNVNESTTKKKEQVNIEANRLSEGYYPINKKSSYNDSVPNVKIIVQHNKALGEGEQRFRYVDKIFLENMEGERFLSPTIKPGLARVYARHLAEGGLVNDERWNHIKELCEEFSKMAGFSRAVRNKTFNESADVLISEGLAHYQNLRETLSKLTKKRGYDTYFENWAPTLLEVEEDNSINQYFTRESLDPRIESVIPILSRLRPQVNEMNEVKELEDWAETVIEEKLELEPSPKSELKNNNSIIDSLRNILTSKKSNTIVFDDGTKIVDPLTARVIIMFYDSIKDPKKKAAVDKTLKTKIGFKTIANKVSEISAGSTFDGSEVDNPLSRIEKKVKKKLSKNKSLSIDEDNLSTGQKKAGQVDATEPAKNISPVIGSSEKKHPFNGKLVGASESKNIEVTDKSELSEIQNLAGIKDSQNR